MQVHVAPIAMGYTVDLCRTVLLGHAPEQAAAAASARAQALVSASLSTPVRLQPEIVGA